MAGLVDEMDRATVDGGVNQPKQISGRRGNDFLNDPQTKAVAEVLYRDKPEQLRDITDVFDALAGANSATRARRPGSSGTAQGMRAGYDAALLASSIISRIRSINRGQLSPTIAAKGHSVLDATADHVNRRAYDLHRKRRLTRHPRSGYTTRQNTADENSSGNLRRHQCIIRRIRRI